MNKDANRGRFARFQLWQLRLAALIFAVLPALWLREVLLSYDGTCERLSGSATPISFVVYYSLLAAGAFGGRRDDSFDLRSGRLLAIMSLVALSTILAMWCGGIEWDIIYLVAPVLLIVGTVFSSVRKLARPSFVEAQRPSGLGRVLQEGYALALRISNPRLLLVAGTVLIFISAWPPAWADSLFMHSWITSSSNVSLGRWTPAVLVRDYGGRVVFVLSVALAFVTAWLTARSLWKRMSIGQMKLTPHLALVSALLLGYTQVDAFHTFLGGPFDGRAAPARYAAWLATAVAFLVNIAASRIHTAMLNRPLAAYLLLLGFPMLLFACPYLPIFAWGPDYTITGAATCYLGVAVLAWGWLKANAGRTTPAPKPAELMR